MSDEGGFSILGIDHIGIATTDLDKASTFWSIIGMNQNPVDELVQDQGVKIRFFEFDKHISQTRVELLEPTAEDTPIGKFISNRGVGIQQVCLEVKGLGKLLEHLKHNQIELIDEIPRKGAHDCIIAFVHPKSTGGVLVELSERSQ
jgi:methylmalonyl-CoA/ethylmalonyl-CoA epimerase